MSRKRVSYAITPEMVILFLIVLSVMLAFFHMAIVVYIGVAMFVAENIWMIIKKIQGRPVTKETARRLDLYVVGLFVLLACAWVTGLQLIFGIIAGVILALVILWQIMKRQKRIAITSEIGNNLHRALETMDTTARWYNNEEEANRELVTCLKAQGISSVVYQYRLGNGRTADAKVGNSLIEGKLSPDTAEVDRLIGQLSEYTQYANKLNVVIYGKFDREARRRIENEIQSRYLGKVFLNYLPNPNRQRAI